MDSLDLVILRNNREEKELTFSQIVWQKAGLMDKKYIKQNCRRNFKDFEIVGER